MCLHLFYFYLLKLRHLHVNLDNYWTLLLFDKDRVASYDKIYRSPQYYSSSWMYRLRRYWNIIIIDVFTSILFARLPYLYIPIFNFKVDQKFRGGNNDLLWYELAVHIVILWYRSLRVCNYISCFIKVDMGID
jgi:hypothetical protein